MAKNPCRQCAKTPVIEVCGNSMCKKHFIRYFERKVVDTISAHCLISMKDRKIAVACSGGKDSTSALYFLQKFMAKTGRSVTAVCIDEGIKGYREHTLKHLTAFCKRSGIPFKVFSFKKEFGSTLDEILRKNPRLKPCSVCGVLRRRLLNCKSREIGFSLIATGHNLDDEAQTMLMDIFRRNVRAMARLGPLAGMNRERMFTARIKPFYNVTEREIMTYAYLNGLCGKYVECPYSADSLRADVRDILNRMEEKHPGTKQSIVNSLLEISPSLKAMHSGTGMKFCSSCGEPASQDKCAACKLAEKAALAR